MEEITLESIRKKLGFDPLNPPPDDDLDEWEIRDDIPSIWAPLSREELAYLIKIDTGVDLSKKAGYDRSQSNG